MKWITHTYGIISILSIIVSIYLSKYKEEMSLNSIGFLSGWILFIFSTSLLLYVLHHSWKKEEEAEDIKTKHSDRIKALEDTLKDKDFELKELKNSFNNLTTVNKTLTSLIGTKDIQINNPNTKNQTSNRTAKRQPKTRD